MQCKAIDPNRGIVISCEYRDGGSKLILAGNTLDEGLALFSALAISASILETDNPIEVMSLCQEDIDGALCPIVDISWVDGPMFPDLSGLHEYKSRSKELWKSLRESARRTLGMCAMPTRPLRGEAVSKASQGGGA